jgi:hypothetical protein
MTPQHYRWQTAYNAVAVETNAVLLPLRIFEAQSALEERRLSPVEGVEAKALTLAQEVLDILQNERLDTFIEVQFTEQDSRPQ